MAFVDVQNFSYTYPGDKAPTLNDLNIGFDKGAFIVITGKSGSGKSTLGKAIAGYVFQDEEPNYSGQIIVNNVNMAQSTLYESSERVAYVQQNPEDQFCTLTVLDEIAFGLENHCVLPEKIERTIDEVLSIVNGSDLKYRFLATLSGGEKQKIAIASMLALSPDVLILDEPTSNLDPIATENIFATLSAIRQDQDLTIIIIEHKLSQLESHHPEILRLEAGEITPFVSPPDYQPGPTKFEYIIPTSGNSDFQDNNCFIELKDASVDCGGNRILNNINLTTSPGEFISLMGPNGSGKTTLLESIMGFHEINSGSIKIFDVENKKWSISGLVPHVGFIFQNPDNQLFTQSVWAEAIYTAKNLKIFDSERKDLAEALLGQMGLLTCKETHPHRLSYGEKRRLNLISAMLHGPQLLLIDELLIGQDMDNAHIWMRFLQTYTEYDNSVVLVNHHSDLSQEYCSRVLFMEKGQLIIDQKTPEVFSLINERGYRNFIPSIDRERIYA